MKRKANILFLAAVFAVMLAVPAVSFLGPRATVSYYEQRTLAAFPVFSWESVLDGTYFSQIETYATDHIHRRDDLMKADTAINMMMNRPKVNDLMVDGEVLLNAHGYSRWSMDYVENDARTAAESYAALAETVASYGGYYCYLGIPLQGTYFAGEYPDYMDDRLWQTETIRETFGREMAAAGVPFIDMHEKYAEMGYPKEFYFETDHHFTLRGAYAAYEVLMEHLQREGLVGENWLREEDFIWQTRPNPFLGSSNRKLYGLWPTEDAVEVALPTEDIPFVRHDGEREADYIYALPANESERATYSVYMGGDLGLTVIKTGREELPNVLIYGDSFTNAIETLLWTGFNETHVLDFRYYSEKTLGDYVAEYQPDIVICVRDEMTYLSLTGNGSAE